MGTIRLLRALVLFTLLFGALFSVAVENTTRGSVPRPLPHHPGNVFLEGESIAIPVPETLSVKPAAYTITDDSASVIQEGAWPGAGTTLTLPPYPVGWYRLEYFDASKSVIGWTAFAVLAPLKAPVPSYSPISVDTASAWFERDDAAAQQAYMSLASLAGVNWMRDRLTWSALEPEEGVITDAVTSYDTSADAAQAAGLRVLQVLHATPPWAADVEKDSVAARQRFPRDLRTIHRFYKAMVQRYKGRIDAWEPWNEPNIIHFGGHPINEICSLQKAAYLGLKAGDPNVTVGWSVFAGMGSPPLIEGMIANDIGLYMNTFNVHSYSDVHAYKDLMKHANEAKFGKPIWLTECGIRLTTDDAAPWGDLTPEKEIAQAAFVAKSYASSLHAGVDNHFFFILGNYIERGVQFGLLRHDMTPRPGYVAFAATGRLMAGAHPLGRMRINEEENGWAYAFRAVPDGIERDVFILWADMPCPFPDLRASALRGVYDYLGREIALPSQLGTTPLFLVYDKDSFAILPLEPPQKRIGAVLARAASPVVMQVDMPLDATVLSMQAYKLPPDVPSEIPVWLYNFSDKTAVGSVALREPPEGWNISLPNTTYTLEAGARIPITLTVSPPEGIDTMLESTRITLGGRFDIAGNSFVSFRVCADRDKLVPVTETAITGGNAADNWRKNVATGSTMTLEAIDDGWIDVTAEFGGGAAWLYPKYPLAEMEKATATTDALAFDVDVTHDAGSFHVQFREASGAMYVIPVSTTGKEGARRVRVFFDQARQASYGKPDPNNHLDPENIVEILIGLSSKPNSTTRFAMKNLAWLEF